MAVGTLGVVAGVHVLSGRGSTQRDWPLWALALPVGAAAIRAGAHVVVKWGLLLLPNVVLSGLASYCVSSVVALGLRRVRGGTRSAALRGPGLGWFIGSGCLYTLATLCLNLGLLLGDVVQVSPLVSTYPLFTMLGSRLFYGQELIGRRTVLAVLLIVGSVVLITVAR